MKKKGDIVLYQNDVEKLEQIRGFIDQNFDEELTLKEISVKFAISKSTLRRHFLAHHQESISNYIYKCRMICAINSILNRTIPINQIGIRVGYNDRSAFTHAFTKFFGNPPAYFLRHTMKGEYLNTLTT